ncbi:MAG: glycosyltransferase family 2 protein [Methanosarcina flavescens]
MNNELSPDKSSQCMVQCEEKTCKEVTVPQNITVVLPAYNEEVAIGSIVLLTCKYADNVIVVDDGSSDRTADVARKAGAEVIVHEVNKGKGRALKTGFTAAVALGADIIVTMDSDGQHNPADIPKLVEPILKGEADMVNGSRYLNGLDKNTPAYRRVGQTILDEVTNLNSGLHITDSQSGFRAFAASTKDVFRFNARGMAIESEMLADAGHHGLRITEVEIGVRYDVDGSTENPIKHGFGVLMMVLKDIEFNRPLYYLTLPGSILGIIGLIMGVIFLREFILGKNLYFGPTMLMVLCIVIGSFMALMGIMLHSVSTILRDALKG